MWDCTVIAFVKGNVDSDFCAPDFCVPDDKYNGPDSQTYLILEGKKNAMDSNSDLSHTDLKDIDDSKFHESYYQMNENNNSITWMKL